MSLGSTATAGAGADGAGVADAVASIETFSVLSFFFLFDPPLSFFLSLAAVFSEVAATGPLPRLLPTAGLDMSELLQETHRRRG